ncbi:hypothetical protein JCM5353_008106 [Sporobolomyces roseus]
MSDEVEGLPSRRSKGSSEDSEADREVSEGSRVDKKVCVFDLLFYFPDRVLTFLPSPQIDRLSLLPNELLDQIFDTAYSIDTPSTGALSKRLLPFHITGIYRRIELSSDQAFVALVVRTNGQPLLGDMIEILDVDLNRTWRRAPCEVDPEVLKTFYSHLNRVVEISIKGNLAASFALVLPSSASSTFQLPHLSTVTSPLAADSLVPFQIFSPLSSLNALHITNFDDYFELENDQTPPFDLPLLTILSIEGHYADQPSIGKFCQSCPSLQDLTLTASSADYSHILPGLSDRLTRLSLWEPSDQHGANHCDHFLPRFPNLIHLSLGSYLFSEDLTQHLAHLLSLEELELGVGAFSISEMIELIDGDLPELGFLYFDSVKGVPGYQLQCRGPGSTSYFITDDEEFWQDWDVPEFSQEDGWGFEDARELLTSALAAGIDFEGDLDMAIVTMEAYLYEVANLAIIRSYLDRDLSHVENLQNDSNLNLRLPPIDLEKLDPNNLQLVKLSQSVGPCDYWDLDGYNLSLENHRTEEGEKEERRDVELLDCELVVHEKRPWPEILWK